MRMLEELKLSDVPPSPTTQEILEIEKYIGYSLPHTYREFLKQANGGHPEVDTFEDNDGEQWAVNNFFSISSQFVSNDLIWNYQHRWSDIPESFLPIARDGFGNLFLLDLRNGSDGVWIWAHDEPDNKLSQLTTDFEEFVNKLQTNTDYI